jgi:hypothetical protein
MATQIDLPENELNEFDLPRVCIVTGATDGVVFKPVKFSWYPPWVGALVIFNLLIAAIVASILTKRVKGQLPFTEEAFKQWKQGQLFFGLSIVAAIALFAGAFILFFNELAPLGALAMVATIAVPVVVFRLYLRNRAPVVKRIADGRVTLVLPSDAAVVAIRNHLFAGKAAVGASAGVRRSA